MEALGPDDPISVGQYTIHGVLGRGGMGIVYLGSHRRQLAAVKVMNPILSLDLKFKIRFRREIEAVKKVNGRFTAKILDHGSDNGRLWYASEYIAGLTLKQAVAVSRFSGAAFFILARSMCFALAEIHAARIVHRDLKPSNIILGQDGLKIVDFGVAHVIDEATITNGALVGTPDYMAPEQFRGQPASAAWDVFALGNLLTFAATGQPAFGTHGTLASAAHAILTYVPYEQGMTPAMCAITDRCLEKDPKKRATLSDITALFPTMVQTQVASTSWLPASVSTKVLECDTKILPDGTLVLPGPQVQRPAARPVAVAPKTSAKPKVVAPKTTPQKVAPATTAKPGSIGRWFAQLAIWGLFLLLIVFALWRAVLLPYQRDHNSTAPSTQPSVQTSAKPPLDLPIATFTKGKLGKAYGKNAAQYMVVNSAERELVYGVKLTVTVNGYTKDAALEAAKKSCTQVKFSSEYSARVRSDDFKAISSNSDGSVTVALTFVGALGFSGNIKFYSECDTDSNNLLSADIGNSTVSTIGVMHDKRDSKVAPVLVAKRQDSQLKVVIPNPTESYAYCLKTGNIVTEPAKKEVQAESGQSFEVLTFTATAGTLYMGCQKDTSGKITYTGTGVEIK